MFKGGEGEVVASRLAKFWGVGNVNVGEALPTQPLSTEGPRSYLSPDRKDLWDRVLQGSPSCECS